MSSLVGVADACVLVPAALCDLLLRSAAAGLFRLQWTDEILDEVQRTLVNDLGKSEDQARRRIEAMKDAFPQALITHHVPLIAAMPNDPKDRHVLAAAVASGAEVIVTANLKDFSSKALAPFPVEAQSPDRFLLHLLDADRDLLIEVLTQQAAALRHPPKTVRDICDALARDAPQFAARLIRESGL